VMIEALGEKEDEEGGKTSVTIDSCAQVVSPVIERYFEETKV
jgi:hypothetical protein